MEKYEIYKVRLRIEDFGVDEKNTINNALYNALLNTKFILSKPRKEQDILDIFNDVYYVCTRILIDKRPYFQISEYKSIVSSITFNPNRYVVAMSMVLVYLKSLDLITDDIDKTINVIKNDVISYDITDYNEIIGVVKRFNAVKATIFLPLNYPDGDYSNYWECYHSFPKVLEETVERLISKEKSKGKTGEKDVKASYLLSGWSGALTLEEKNNEIKRLQKERDEWKKKYEDLINTKPEEAFNGQTRESCFTSRQMSILLTAVGRLTEKDNPPGKTTLGEIVERISGYKATTAGTNMKGSIPAADTKTVAKTIEDKFPNLANEVRKLSIEE